MAEELEERFPDIKERMEKGAAESLAREGLKAGERGSRTKELEHGERTSPPDPKCGC